ncbi:MAG: hypothetical protein IIA45_04275 [Bacteroidetes bacterium]|nr:hypothetical protein [Bacteroidota bacterium]
MGTQNPQTVITDQYIPISANLSISILPVVSGNDQVTLDIKVEMTNFTGKSSPNAPPGSATRQFESLIRVKNNEMIMLGGLEEKEYSETGSGLPFLSRVPVLKWFFSSRTKTKSTGKLSIFIKPTIIY